MNLNGIDAGFEAGQLTLSARLGGGGRRWNGGGSGGDQGYYVQLRVCRGYTTGTAAPL